MSTVDGGPAFPVIGVPCGFANHPIGCRCKTDPGASLRDYFAAHAPMALLDNVDQTRESAAKEIGIPTQQYIPAIHYPLLLAKRAMVYADAMLIARGDAGPEFEAEREAKIEAWLERDRYKEALSEATKALTAIRNRVDELETSDHKPVDFTELRGLQEEAVAAIRKAEAAGVRS